MLDSSIKDQIRTAFKNGTLQVRSARQDGTVEWRPISNTMKHATRHKKAFRVSCVGASVVATEDHSLFTFSGDLEVVQTSKLNPGVLLAVASEGHITGRVVSEVVEVNPLIESYDISVPGLENFILSNGIVAHNSYSIGGVSLDVDKASKYESAASAQSEQFDKQLENAKKTVKIVKGLQQPRFGTGIRSAFGPYTGAGVLSPRKFVGF